MLKKKKWKLLKKMNDEVKHQVKRGKTIKPTGDFGVDVVQPRMFLPFLFVPCGTLIPSKF